MEERLIDSIVKHLNNLMPEINVYTDESYMDDDRPSAFLEVISVNQEDCLYPYFFEIYSFDLMFDPRPCANPYQECRKMAGFLRVNLREIPDFVDGVPHYTYNIDSRIVGGQVHVEFDIRCEYYLEDWDVPVVEDVDIDFTEEDELEKCILKKQF